MVDTHPFTLHANDIECEALNHLAAMQGLTHEQVLRQALRLYQRDYDQREKGLLPAWTRNGRIVQEPSMAPPHEPTGIRYTIKTVADLAKVPAECRAEMFHELELALLFNDLVQGDEGQEPLTAMYWTDDGKKDAHMLGADGEPMLSLNVTTRDEAVDEAQQQP